MLLKQLSNLDLRKKIFFVFLFLVLFVVFGFLIIKFGNEVLRSDDKIAETNFSDSNTVLEPTGSLIPKKETTLKKIKENGRYIYFEGEVTLSGQYSEEDPYHSPTGGLLCFFPDEETNYLVPRGLPDSDGQPDTRAAWFCFKDQIEAKKIFGINDEIFNDRTKKSLGGSATIIISNYVIDLFPAAVFDTAQLKEIVSKEVYSISSN